MFKNFEEAHFKVMMKVRSKDDMEKWQRVLHATYCVDWKNIDADTARKEYNKLLNKNEVPSAYETFFFNVK